MAPTQTFSRLIRFLDESGTEQYGDAPTDVTAVDLPGYEVNVLDGSFATGFRPCGSRGKIKKLLCPVPPTRILPCIGLNYMHHAKEANLAIPSYPVVFAKPPDALAGPGEVIHIHPDVQKKLDYEGELTVVIGKDAKNVSASEALEYVMGYTVGNDVSARDFQMPADVCGGQFGYAKSFDQFAPVGPWITAAHLIDDPQKLNYVTKVNGEIRQQTNTSDMIWTVAQIIEHLSRATTLRAGTCIMTGTPSGVGLFMNPPQFLKDGDVVEIEIDGIGKLSNTMHFEK